MKRTGRTRGAHLPEGKSRPRVVWQTGPPALVAAFGGDPWCLARITTPFILERANHAKVWDAKRQTAGGKPPWWLRCRRDEHEANSPSVPRLTATGSMHEVVPPIRGWRNPVCRSPPRFSFAQRLDMVRRAILCRPWKGAWLRSQGDSLGASITTRKPTSFRGSWTERRPWCLRSVKRNTSSPRKVPPRKWH
jgi:hypothetical protein